MLLNSQSSKGIVFCFYLAFITPEGFTTMVANEGLEIKPGTPGPTALHSLLSRLLGGKNPCCYIVGLHGTWGLWLCSVLQYFNHLATEEPLN